MMFTSIHPVRCKKALRSSPKEGEGESPWHPSPMELENGRTRYAIMHHASTYIQSMSLQYTKDGKSEALAFIALFQLSSAVTRTWAA